MKKQKKNEEITTIPKLAVLINSGFQTAKEHADEKFSEIDRRFDKVENRLDKVENRLDKVENRLSKVEKKFDGFIDTHNEDKLPMRVEYIENVLNLPKK